MSSRGKNFLSALAPETNATFTLYTILEATDGHRVSWPSGQTWGPSGQT